MARILVRKQEVETPAPPSPVAPAGFIGGKDLQKKGKKRERDAALQESLAIERKKKKKPSTESETKEASSGSSSSTKK
jgi:hypothetical protein